jgi:23S rRNA (pseudouridine1915-N3)-methyltransferase
MTIKLLCVGKTKEKYVQAALEEYLKRLRHYVPVDYSELKAEKRKKTESDELIKQREGERIMKALPPQGVVIALDERGTQYSSLNFSHWLERYQNRGDIKTVTFVTGGATGFSQSFLHTVEEIISFSKMTFPHQLCRVILVEQLYRAYTILAGESYHKE